MKVHNCLDCPLTYIQEGQSYRRRNCTDEMCDTMFDKPSQNDVDFFKTFHSDTKDVEPLKELVRIWIKNTEKQSIL